MDIKKPIAIIKDHLQSLFQKTLQPTFKKIVPFFSQVFSQAKTFIREQTENNTKEQKIKIAIVATLSIVVLTPILLPASPKVPDFSEYPAGEKRKQEFFTFLLPHISERNEEILNTRQKLLALQEKKDKLNWFQKNKVKKLAAEYNIEEFSPENKNHWDSLLRRVDVVPPSLALAQAANESAWGTSRFAREGNNLYGQWCYTPGCGIVPDARPTDATYEVASYKSVTESVETYIRNLNRNSAYSQLRDIRKQLRENNDAISGQQLAAGLLRYSERGEAYIEELRNMISYNELGQLDLQL